MRLHVNNGGGVRTVAIAIDDPDASVRDLAAALGFDLDSPLVLDGFMRGPDVRLTEVGLVEGSAVESHPASGFGTAVDQDALEVGVVAGPGSGTVCAIGDNGAVTIGRDPGNDLNLANETVSIRHAQLRTTDGTLEIADCGSTNGTWCGTKSVSSFTPVELGERVRLGSSVLRVERRDIQDRPVGVGRGHADRDGRILFNRPPRQALPDEPAEVALPEARPERSNPVLSVVSLVVPVVFAAVMIAVTGRWQYAVFALLSPMMLLGNHLAGRRRVRKDRRGDRSSHASSLARFERQLGHAVDVERERRRAVAPDLVEVRRRVELPSSMLWQRRPDAADSMVIGLGRGKCAWEMPLASTDLPDADTDAVVDRHRTIDDIELLADLRSGPLGFVGDAEACRGAVRAALLQLATHHGPADLSVAVLTSERHLPEWRWAQWLPHSTTTGPPLVLAGDAARTCSERLMELLDSGQSPPRGWLLVVDDIDLLHGRSSPTRRLLGAVDRGVFGLMIAGSADQLPASTATVVDIAADGAMTCRTPGVTALPSTGVADLATNETATEIARSMARFEDPELVVAGGGLPRAVRPDDIWGDFTDPEELRRRWRSHGESVGLVSVVGMGDGGPLHIDLVHDGPHALVAGTTGAGKSEFLRTLIGGLACNHDPGDLVFVLIDYKGGAAFDCCADLPHVVGMVTDLDDHLAERALESLEAELRHREEVLRRAGAADIGELQRSGAAAADLPRLVVIVDEFATLRSELPDFVASLVGIAQRGRSLGVHLILATQRPSGAVDANIKANTNLRVALRVQDAADSSDVIDCKAASGIDRSTPGRGYVRRGEGDLAAVQAAYISGPRPAGSVSRLRAVDCEVGSGVEPTFPAATSATDRTDLETLVAAVVAAAEGMSSARRPWLDDLEADIHPDRTVGLRSGDDAPVVLAVGDDPARQRRVTLGWNPGEGHLVVLGVLGSGVTTTLRSLVHRIANGVDGRPAWVFAADHAAGGLAGIGELDHVACHLEPTDEARHERLLTVLGDMLDRRRTMRPDEVSDLPLAVLVIDGLAGFAELTQTGNSGEKAELFDRIVRDGPAVGIVLVAGASRVGEVPRSLLSASRQRLALELADPGEYQLLGVRSHALPRFHPGRALVGTSPMVAQIIDWSLVTRPGEELVPVPPPRIEKLAEIVKRSDLGAPVVLGPELIVPFALDDETRAAAALVLLGGEHALIAGPSGSGRSTALSTIARQLRDADPALVLVGVAPRGDAPMFESGALDAGGTLDALRNVLEMAKTDLRRWVVLVDDADRIECESGPLLDLARNARPGLSIIASGRSAAVRQSYGHWLRFIRSSGTGILLNPDNGVDGELLAVRLPRGVRLPMTPGRGYLVRSGGARIVQVAI